MASFLLRSARVGCRNRCRLGTLCFRGEGGRGGRDGVLFLERFEGELGGDWQTENDTKRALHRYRHIQRATELANKRIRLEDICRRGCSSRRFWGPFHL